MKKYNRFLSGILALVLMVSLAVTVFADVYETEAGATVTVTFTVPKSFGVDGSFSFSNKDMFSEVSYVNKSGLEGRIDRDIVFLHGSEETDIQIDVVCTVNDSAKPGDQCDITLQYEAADLNGHFEDGETEAGTDIHWEYITHTVIIKAEETTEEVTTAETTEEETTIPAPVETVVTTEAEETTVAPTPAKPSPQTGDSVTLWVLLVVIAATGVAVLGVTVRRSKKD